MLGTFEFYFFYKVQTLRHFVCSNCMNDLHRIADIIIK